MRRLLLLTIVAAAIAAGCGTSGGKEATETTTAAAETTDDEGRAPGPDDETSGTEGQGDDANSADYEAAVVAQMTSTDSDESLVLSKADAECVARVWVEAMTVDRLAEEGITTEDLSDPSFNPGAYGFGAAAGEAMVGAFADCDIDLVELVIESIARADSDLGECLEENLDGEQLLDLLARDIGGEDTDEEFEAAFDSLEGTCDLFD